VPGEIRTIGDSKNTFVGDVLRFRYLSPYEAKRPGWKNGDRVVIVEVKEHNHLVGVNLESGESCEFVYTCGMNHLYREDDQSK
jgi:hypothetical protein